MSKPKNRRRKKIKKNSLKIIFGQSFIDYPTALEWCGLTELTVSRQNNVYHLQEVHWSTLLEQKCSHPIMNMRKESERYEVNFAHTEIYRQSAVPCCQRWLNKDTKIEYVTVLLKFPIHWCFSVRSHPICPVALGPSDQGTLGGQP